MSDTAPAVLDEEVLAAMAHQSSQTDEGDALCFTASCIARTIGKPANQVEASMMRLLKEGLAYKPFPTRDERFTSLTQSGLARVRPSRRK